MNFRHPKQVAYQCTRCALCCGDTAIRTRHILLVKTEAQQISKILQKAIETFATKTKHHRPYVYEMKKTINEGKCIFLENTTCTIYAARPLICRFYPFRLQTTRKGSHQFHYTKECPGIGKGKQLNRDHFENLFREARERLNKTEEFAGKREGNRDRALRI